MPAEVSRSTIREGRFPGLDRHACQIELDVPRELFRGSIPAFRLLAQRLHYYCVEIAPQTPLQFAWLQAALVAHRLRSDCSSGLAVVSCPFFCPIKGSARFFRVGVTNQTLDFQKGLAGETIRPMAGQQLKERYPQRIDIG